LKGRRPGYFLISVHFHAPGSGSAFPITIGIQDSQINADPDPQHWFLFLYIILELPLERNAGKPPGLFDIRGGVRNMAVLCTGTVSILKESKGDDILENFGSGYSNMAVVFVFWL
jgi:hypothetical protein